ncbi:hypothetical protein [Paenibacillus fonticola]|uniref:hypothetical protein n=1 Tax=Paenibacillus fonticola TaxID=379896 RepID=UPI000370A0DA|nr:hypothetical protein [Paenibacillus fonticola]
MYKELDALLTDFQDADNYWFDTGCLTAEKLIILFKHEDWNELSHDLLTKPLGWQKKLAYCLGNDSNLEELKILLTLASVEDADLFEVCIDSLRSFTSVENKQIILENRFIIEKVKEAIPSTGIVSRGIFQDFLNELTNKAYEINRK